VIPCGISTRLEPVLRYFTLRNGCEIGAIPQLVYTQARKTVTINKISVLAPVASGSSTWVSRG
jgi:hypothetical protein